MSPIPLLGDVSLTTGATDLLSISLSSTQKSTLGTVAYNPWRLDEKARALWGLQFLAASDTEKLNGTLGVNYHWSFRSVLNRCFIGIETEAIEIIPNSGSPEEYNIKIGEAVDAHPLLWLLPRFTLGVQTFVKPFEPLTEAAGFFDGVAGNVALSWRGQLWLEIDLLGSLTLKPTSDGSDGYNQIFKAGATIIVIPPSISAAMGAKHYGQKYYDSDYQTGLGFGAYGSFLQCVHGERSAASCADGKVQEISGGVLTEVRVSNKLRPRLSLGVSNTSQALTDEVTSQVVLDVALQMAFALTSNAQ